MARKEPTIASILQHLSEQYDGPVAEREVFDQVLAARPSTAKDPYARIREQIRFESVRVGWVSLGNGELVPLRVALAGLRFRLTPDAEQVDQGAILRDLLRPFVHYLLKIPEVRFEDEQGRPIKAREIAFKPDDSALGLYSHVAVELGEWFRRADFAPGDSILVTIGALSPFTLRLAYEPAAQFDAAAVAPQDQELLEALVARVQRGGRSMLRAEDCVLPIFARAAWRTAYPGRPWQVLVTQDRRLRLLEAGMIADSSFRRPLDLFFGAERDANFWEETDNAALEAIRTLQESLRNSRREAVERGIWNGIAPRVSTARTIFDVHQGTAETLYPGAVNTLEDHTADIEEHVVRGDYAELAWDSDDMDELNDMLLDDDFDLDDDMLDLDEIEDIQSFVEQNPALSEATRRLMDSLSPDELERLQNAETIEDVQGVLASRLNDLLRTEPSLFVPLEPPTPGSANGNGHANGNGQNGLDGVGDLNGFTSADARSPFDETYGEDDDLLDSIDGELLDTDIDEDEDEEDQIQVEMALERSNELMERFYQHQINSGKSETTAATRTRDLAVYAEFLGNYYGRSLDTGDYATLDECLFFYYPRRVMNSSPRGVREICTSLKQFYAFLKSQSILPDDSFAVAIWQRRDQAARVVELYEQIDSDSPQFERLFGHLFAPYTA